MLHKKLYPDSFLNTKKINCSWSISVAGWNSQKLNHPKKQSMSLMNVHITLLWDTSHNNTTGKYRY